VSPQLIKNTDIVVGDVMQVDTGDKIIADGIMIDGHHLVVDEASLTGEVQPHMAVAAPNSASSRSSHC
jgi:P-type E1-E2 ATPase